MSGSVRLVSVNVATPRFLGEKNGAPVISAIAKIPVAGLTIRVHPEHLDGDAQANLEKHGGPDKAVYAYPADHWPWWETEKHFPCRPGAFGENLTLQGADETTVRIGDRFAWGEAVLEVSQPRSPCSKFQLYSGRADAGALMTISGRSGWYFRVLKPGMAPIADTTMIPISSQGGPTVRDAFFAGFDKRFDPGRRKAIADLPTLSEAWRIKLQTGAD